MLIIEIKKGESFESALKKLKNKFRNTKVSDELKNRSYFSKPSVTKREKKQKAIFKQNKKNQEES